MNKLSRYLLVPCLLALVLFYQILNASDGSSPSVDEPQPGNDQSMNHPGKAGALPDHAVILLYHHVDTSTPALTSISPDDFERQLTMLAEQQFTVWPLEKIVRHLQEKISIPDKVVAITFDDSYQSVFTTAYPLLKQRRWPFTIFVSTDSIDQAYNLQTSWDQLREMAANGATIANHSSSHKHLLHRLANETPQQWRQRVIRDIQQAEQRIIDEIGYSKKLFAYPYGEYNQTLKDIVTELGYTGFGQQSGPVGSQSDYSAIPRFPFAGQYTELDEFLVKMLTVPFSIESLSAADNPLAHAKNRPVLQVTFKTPPANKHSMQCFGSMQGKLPLQWLDANTFSVVANEAIPVGRSRYNCTAVFKKDNQALRYYWFSHLWIRLDKGEQWILD